VPYELLGRTRFPRITQAPYVVTLAPYGFFWFQLRDEAEPSADVPKVTPEFVTLVLSNGLPSLLDTRPRRAFDHEVLPHFLPGRRWFGDKGTALLATQLEAGIPLDQSATVLLTVVKANTAQAVSRYLLPLTIKWTRFTRILDELPNVVAAVRRGSREGTLLDASADRHFILQLLEKVHAGSPMEVGPLRLEFQPSTAFAKTERPSLETVRAVEGEQSNTTVIADAKYVVKMFRRVNAGIHPEIEIGRFLTDVVGFTNTAPFLGSVQLFEGDACSALAVVHGYVENQGDAWSVTNAYLDRFIDEQRLLTPEAPARSSEQSAYLLRLRQIGRRTAEMHAAFASRADISDFAPERASAAHIEAWTQGLFTRAEALFEDLSRRLSNLDDRTRPIVESILTGRAEVLRHISRLLTADMEITNIRHHGDFHLGQMVFAKDDVFIIDFEGEPQRSLAERREKAPAARDVAGLLRSIDYSATAAFERALQASPDEHGKLFHALEGWREAALEVFLTSYREALATTQLWPSDTGQADHLLQFFLLQKAVYEVNYELANRPTWLRVPLVGLQRILSSLTA
jgi:maltose alpha-D-glucosyltransferase / alpha-amylase